MALKTLPLILALLAILYKNYLHDVVTITFGIGRTVQPISDFPEYACKRLHHPLLESCEDLWLDTTGRKLYAACSTVESRKGWSPGGNKYDVSAMSKTDHVAVLDIDSPGEDGLYGLKGMEVFGYEGELSLHGFDVREMDDGERLRFWLINHRAPRNATTGEALDATVVGANSTVEIFDMQRGSNRLEHVKTIASEYIISPNDLVVADDGVGFLITNDHNTKTGTFRDLSVLTSDGNVAYCSSKTGYCHLAASAGFQTPNGIAKGHDGLYYVSNSAGGKITVHELTDTLELVQVDQIPLYITIDNLSVDEEGSIFAAAFPDVIGLVKAFSASSPTDAPSTVLKIQKTDAGYKVSKEVEDKDAKVLTTTSSAVRDVKSGQLFLGGVASQYITICERQS